MDTTAVVSIQGLVKTFGSTRALNGLDLEVKPGEVHGFLGPNGAGKTTTLRVLLGLLRADSGQVRLLGGHPWNDAVELHRRLAYVPGEVELWPNITGGEAIDIFARLRGGLDARRRDALCERFDLDPTKKSRTYSEGNRQKVALISALVADVELLPLDEPTSGLDPLMEVVFQQCISEAKDAGKTVLLSSHILAQVEALADRVSIIRNGKNVETGTLSDMRHMSRTTLIVETTQPTNALTALPGVHDLSINDGATHLLIDRDQVEGVVQALAPLGVHSLIAHPPTLEQLLFRHHGEELVEQDQASRSTK